MTGKRKARGNPVLREAMVLVEELKRTVDLPLLKAGVFKGAVSVVFNADTLARFVRVTEKARAK